MINKQIIRRLRAMSIQRLAEIWCELNRWEWPIELLDIKPDDWRQPHGTSIAQTLGWQIMEEVRVIIADKVISREWNKREMSDEEFEAWYPAERAP